MNWADHNLIQHGDVVSIAQWQEFEWLKQGFSLKSAGNVDERFGDAADVRKKLSEALRFLPGQWTNMRQVHGSNVEYVDVADESGFPETDGLLTSNMNILLAVVVADCVPLLFVDPAAKRIAAAHAGRRGTQAGIAKITFKEFLKRGSQPQDVQVVIGPSIGPCCYEVNPRTHEIFDLWGTNQQQLRDAGAETIIRTDVCTKDHNDLFFSHRADEIEGRFAGLIGIV